MSLRAESAVPGSVPVGRRASASAGSVLNVGDVGNDGQVEDKMGAAPAVVYVACPSACVCVCLLVV